MNYSSLLLKRILGFVSLIILASLANPQQSFASNGKEKRQRSLKISKTTHTITLEYIDYLITEAKKGDEKAQDKLIDLPYMQNVITPGKIDFLNWKTPNAEETIANRCYINDNYATFVLIQFTQEEIKEHFPKVFDSIQDRAAQKHAGAQYNLGLMYDYEKGVPEDGVGAVRFYQLAADQGHAESQYRVGFLYEHGKGGLPKDEVAAVRLYQLAANQGNSYGLYRLGFMHVSGKGGLPKDEVAAVRLYQLAADQGNSYGLYRLGLMYEHGKGGLPKDEVEAVRLYQLAANQGHNYSQYRLGLMYQDGKGGLPKDVLMAIGLYQKANAKSFAPYLLSTYLTFTTVESEKTEPEISEDDFLTNFRANTSVLTIDMQEKSLFHTQDSSIIELPKNIFSMNLLYDRYKTIVAVGQDLDYWATTIEENRHPGLLITCIQLAPKLRDEYREGSEGEKTGFCRVDVDGQFYYCIDGNNPKLGYDLKAFLSKKRKFLTELENLNYELLGAKQAFNYVTKLNPSFKPQLEQVEGELKLVPKAREAIEKGFSSLTHIIRQNVGVRNIAFRDTNKEFFK